MNQYNKHKVWQDRLYMILAGIFISSLISSNLIFQKFFYWTPFSFIEGYISGKYLLWLSSYTFELSVGILPNGVDRNFMWPLVKFLGNGLDIFAPGPFPSPLVPWQIAHLSA